MIYNSNGKSNQIKATGTALATVSPLLIAPTNTFEPTLLWGALLTDPYKYSADLVATARVGTPNFTVVANSAAASGASFANAKLASGFTSVAYKGAFGSENWAAGWAHFDPQTLAYTTPGAVK